VVRILALTLGVTVLGIGLAWAGSAVGLWPWPPPASGPLGVGCGLAGAAIIFFEMAILPRKWLRGRRLGDTRLWMRAHIVGGLVCLPVILVHSGFAWGGWLPAVTMALFLLVTASGVWGLLMQQWLPSKLLAEIPNETIASGVDVAMETHVLEAVRCVEGLISVPAGGESRDTATPGRGALAGGWPAQELVAFRDGQLLPYLASGRRSGTALVARANAERAFARLRRILPAESEPAVQRLERLCDLRRQWDTLRRLNGWLHNWLVVHLPLSVAMTVLMVVHALRALKFW
jgi:hypothetical protein